MQPVYLFREQPLWAAIFWFTFAGFFVLGSWMANRERNMARGDDRDAGSKGAIYLFSFLGLGVAFAAPYYIPAARIALPPAPVFTAGMILYWTGVLLYAWSVRTLGTSFRTSVQLLAEQHLVTRGPYRLLRHPAYTGGILIFAGTGLAIGNWVSLAAAAGSVAIGYAWRIRVEERALKERFGAEFEANRQRTWAVIPLVW